MHMTEILKAWILFSTASAQAITFTCNVSVRSVTLDGDVYEPSGMMSGGAALSGSGMLV